MSGAAEQGGGIGASRTGSALEPVARQLYDALTDGCDLPLRWNIRNGYCLRDGTTRKPVAGSYTADWRLARDVLRDGSHVERRANPFVLLQHLRGRCNVAIQTPSWSSLIILDIDRHLPELANPEERFEAELRANGQRDEVLAAVWRAYGFSAERQPVILLTPGSGYHVYLPLDRPWPLAYARQWHEYHLDQHGLGLRPGTLELYPSGVPLRAPCGRKTALVVPRNPDDPDNLQLERVHAWRARRGDVAPVRAFVEAFLQRLEAARLPLEEWLADCPERPAWDPVWGPFGAREKRARPSAGRGALSPHDVEAQKAGGPPGPCSGPNLSISPPAPGPARTRSAGGYLLFGRSYRAKVSALAIEGIADARERHDAGLKMAWYFFVVRGLSPTEALREVEGWLRSRPHAVKPGRGRRWIKKTLVEVAHYLRRLERSGRTPTPRTGRGASFGVLGLSPSDDTVLDAAAPELQPEARALLAYFATFSDGQGRVAHPVNLPRILVESLCGHRRIVDDHGRRRRAAVLAVEDLERLGILALHTDYSTGRHGRRYTVWYRFGSGELPEQRPEGLVVGRREVSEGELVAVILHPGEPPAGRLCKLRDGVTIADATDSWWRRMYARRAFTPAEFFDADERRSLPGPFRDRLHQEPKAMSSPAIALPDSLPPRMAFVHSATVPAALPASSAGIVATAKHARPCVCATCCASIKDAGILSCLVPPLAMASKPQGLPFTQTCPSELPSAIPPGLLVPIPLRAALEAAWASWARSHTGSQVPSAAATRCSHLERSGSNQESCADDPHRPRPP